MTNPPATRRPTPDRAGPSERGGKRPGAGRKPKDGPPLVKRTIALEQEHWDKLDWYASLHKISKALALRVLIDEGTR